MRWVVGVVLGLAAAALTAVTLGAYVFSTFCWEYCEPGTEPTFWDGFKFALPFGLLAIGLMTGAAAVVMRGRASFPKTLAIGIGLCLLTGPIVWGVVALVAA